jgi:hypothetical protein
MKFQKGHPDLLTPEARKRAGETLRKKWAAEWMYRKPQYAEGHKRCSACREVKPFSEFTRVNARDGYYSYCRPCARVISRPYRRKTKLKIRYGITEQQYNDLLIAQSGRCALCSEPFDERYKGTSVSLDHDHRTKALRELVHNNCNCVLGYADDRIEILEKAIEYLKKHAR